MGIYAEYIKRNFSRDQLNAERKAQLRRIAAIRGKDVLVYAADLQKSQIGAPVTIDYSDILPIADELSNLSGAGVDVILETPGGDGTSAEDIVRLLRQKYPDDVNFIVPGIAKSAGTIMVMSGDEILMGPASALGPIDAQLVWQGKVFSAEALLEGVKKIAEEVSRTGTLNKAYVPILQQISPGELQNAQNALDFAKDLVREWLTKYKFKNWNEHSSDHRLVTDEDRIARAKTIADELGSHKHWLIHGRSIKIEDLRKMRLQVTDFTAGDPHLSDAILRYHVLMQMTLNTDVYKMIETPDSQIYRQIQVQVAQQQVGSVNFDLPCACGKVSKLQANINGPVPIQPGNSPFPTDNKFKCPQCQTEHDLSKMRQQIEAQTGGRVV